MDPAVIMALAGVSSALGLLSLLAYFYLFSQSRRVERSVRQIVEGEGLFNASLVLEILKQFSTDQARLEALVHLKDLDEHKARVVYGKIKKNVDVTQLQRITDTHRLRAMGLTGVVLLLLGVLGATLPWHPAQLASPVLVSPVNGAIFSIYPRTLNLAWEPVNGALGYVLEVEIQDPATSSWHPHPFGLGHRTVDGTSVRIEFVGSQPGRWRVAAMGEAGRLGQSSEWSTFEFIDKAPAPPESSPVPPSTSTEGRSESTPVPHTAATPDRAIQAYHLRFARVRGNATGLSRAIEPYWIAASPLPGQAVIDYADAHEFAAAVPAPADTRLRLIWRDADRLARSLDSRVASLEQWVNAYLQEAFVPEKTEFIEGPSGPGPGAVAALCVAEIRPGAGNLRIQGATDVFVDCFEGMGDIPEGALRLVRTEARP